MEVGGLMTYLNPSGYLKVKEHTDIIEQFDYVTMDGIFLLKFLEIFRVCNCKRATFDMGSLAPMVFNYASKNKKSVYFLGSDELSLQQARKNIADLYKQLNIVGVHNGYMTAEERILELKNISNINPDILICGMGTLHQEKFLIELKNWGWKGVGFCCGAFFHQTAKNAIYYPSFVNKYHFRWLYRMYKEPKVIKRYIVDYTKFIFVFLSDVIKYKR